MFTLFLCTVDVAGGCCLSEYPFCQIISWRAFRHVHYFPVKFLVINCQDRFFGDSQISNILSRWCSIVQYRFNLSWTNNQNIAFSYNREPIFYQYLNFISIHVCNIITYRRHKMRYASESMHLTAFKRSLTIVFFQIGVLHIWVWIINIHYNWIKCKVHLSIPSCLIHSDVHCIKIVVEIFVET